MVSSSTLDPLGRRTAHVLRRVWNHGCGTTAVPTTYGTSERWDGRQTWEGKDVAVRALMVPGAYKRQGGRKPLLTKPGIAAAVTVFLKSDWNWSLVIFSKIVMLTEKCCLIVSYRMLRRETPPLADTLTLAVWNLKKYPPKACLGGLHWEAGLAKRHGSFGSA